jgi:hypothetical protein
MHGSIGFSPQMTGTLSCLPRRRPATGLVGCPKNQTTDEIELLKMAAAMFFRFPDTPFAPLIAALSRCPHCLGLI